MEVIFEFTHPTPCQPSLQGSPPFVVQLGSPGDPSAVYKPFIAKTDRHKKNKSREETKMSGYMISDSKLNGRKQQGK